MLQNTNIDIFEVFPWNDGFETGNNKIDEQHKILVELVNKLAVALVNQNLIELNETFEELISYANKHFSDEEKIWLEYFPDDPWLISHQKTHASFLPSVMEIKKKAANDLLPEIIEKVLHYLLQWLIFHIIDTDKVMVFAINSLESGAAIDEAKQLAEEEMSGSKLILIDAILNMYERLSSKTIATMREVRARKEAEKNLHEANLKLERLIITDPLTNIFNRRHFDNTFELLLRKSIREKKALCLMLLDIDFFKKINDHYGHLFGDQALERMSSCLKELCRRPDDMAFRIGGEEFCVLTTNENESKAAQFAEKIRMKIENLKIPNEKSAVNDFMTVSIGVAHTFPVVDDGLDGIMKLADKRLYQAKASGRNRVIIS